MYKMYITQWFRSVVFWHVQGLQQYRFPHPQIEFQPFEFFFPFPSSEWLQFSQTLRGELCHARKNQLAHFCEMHTPQRAYRQSHNFSESAGEEW